MEVDRNVRVWRVHEDSEAGMSITMNEATVQADKSTFLTMRPGTIGLNAKRISLGTQPENISQGVIFAGNLGFLQAIPSTAATPIQSLLMTFPGAGIIGCLGEGCATVAAYNSI